MAGVTRRRRNKQPEMERSGDGTVIKYSTLGSTVTTDTSGVGYAKRFYIPGNVSGAYLSNTAGISIAGFYSTGKFTPGTTIRWEPSVSFSTPGRVYVGFTDNPEVANIINQVSPISAYANAVKGLGDVVSFPVWQETEIKFPTKLRRKMFDVNITADLTDSNVLDRCAQTVMFMVVDGTPISTSVGSFWFHDRLQLEGLQPTFT